MEKIVLPQKTFDLYKAGVRTFIHIKRTPESLRLKALLSFGCPVLLVNEQTQEEMQETFWFAFEFKENDRFLLFVFQWQIKSQTFYLRRRRAKATDTRDAGTKNTTFLSTTQKWAKSMLEAYSALLFVSADGNYVDAGYEGDIFSFYREKDESPSQGFIVIDVLKLKMENGKIFKVNSVFPMNLLHDF